LAKADKDWLGRMITRRMPLARWQEAFETCDDDVKTVLDFTQ
jgi:glucose 1-dehydrogenase